MGKFIFTDEAALHIKSISQYTRNKWGNKQQQQYLDALRTTLHTLADNPLMGSLRFNDNGIYNFPYASHSIYYQIHKDCIVVIAILHQSMTPEVHLKNN